MLCAFLPCLLNFEIAGSMANISDRWYFSKEKIRHSPSVQDGIEHAKELGYRQQCANLIQDIGQRIQVNQLVINTAIVYMHRFYMFHSFNRYHRNTMAACFLFLAAKVEEQPRKLDYVLKASHLCLHDKEEPPLEPKSDEYMRISTELVNNESILLQTLGFEVSVDHPNTFVVKCAQLVKASKELAQTAYFLATNSLHLTTFCIQYKPTLVACVCIYVSCLWANFVIPETDGKNWYEFIDNTATKKQVEDLSSYFIKILDSCPTRLKKRLTSGCAVVYKDGKVTVKKDQNEKNSETTNNNSSNNDKSKSKHDSNSSKHASNSNSNNKDSTPKPSHTKSHLTGLLKAHSHDATPPPSSRPHGSHSSSIHSSSSKKPFENNHKRTSAPLPSHSNDHRKVVSTSQEGKEHNKTNDKQKTAEQIKIEQRKKWTPEQWEEYRKRKEKEKLYMQRKKGMETNGKPSVDSNGNKDNHFKQPDRVRKLPHPSESPAKRQKIDHHTNNSTSEQHNRKIHTEKTNSHPQHRNNHDQQQRLKHKSSLLSSSGSDSDSSTNLTKPIKSKAMVNPLPPPPPPPAYAKQEIKQKPIKISPPPPPPTIDPQFY